MRTLYCISGLGADKNVFKHLDLSFAKPVFISWIKPKPKETLPAYALRLKEMFITEPEPLILGLSLGGMLATEITKLTPGTKTVIISSAKTSNELPFFIKLLRLVPAYKILPPQLIRKTSVVTNYFLGAKTGVSKNYLKSVTRNTDLNFYRWAVGAIASWKNEAVPNGLIHIHGTDDKLLPCKFVKPDILIKSGGHLMIIENADEISKLLKQIFAA